MESDPEPIDRSRLPDFIRISFFKSAGYSDTIRSLIQQQPVNGDRPGRIHRLAGKRESQKH